MTGADIPTDPKDALHVLCLFLTQGDEPYSELGFDTYSEAFNEIGRIFHCPANNVRNNRDAFDKLTDSKRVGWQSPLRPALQKIFDAYGSYDRDVLLDLCKKIIGQFKTKPGTGFPVTGTQDISMTQVLPDFTQEIVGGFSIPNFTLTAESYVTTWGFINKPGRAFKLSNRDLQTALEEILAAWPDWTAAQLHNNSVNPDETLTTFAAKHFSKGAHQVLANDQRRGFLHFISAIVFTASRNAPFDQEASKQPLEKKDYEAALALVSGMQRNSAEFAKQYGATPNRKKDEKSFKTGGENVIYYGAPGTGKSYTIDKVVKTKPHVVRTVFHPDLQNSDFFGGLKPQMKNDELRYGFVPGPFMQALRLAYLHTDEMVYLVIEELNRAAAAAVFADLFLLLDRKPDGRGEYYTDFPTVESAAWFAEETGDQTTKLRLPSNLTIYATMNSADQGVYPLDTAFRRRWRQEYIKLEYDKGPDGEFKIINGGGKAHILSWRDFVEKLNNHLLGQDDLGLAEDRLLGQWFVKPGDLTGDDIPGKVLLYLWDDLLRHGGRERVFREEFKTYGGLSSAIQSGKAVFCEAFLEALGLNDSQPDAGDETGA